MAEITAGMQPIGQYLPTKVFKPDMALVEKALGKRQKEYDTKLSMFKKVKAKIDEVNTLDADKDRFFEKQQEYADEIDKISSLYGGDLTKADAEFESLLDKVGEDFNIHGEFRAMDNNYKSAMKNYEELKKRRDKNELTEGQFRSWHRALRNYEGVGTKKGYWNSWNTVQATDAVDIPKFLNEFVKNEKASLTEQGYTAETDAYGKVLYKNSKNEIKTEEEIKSHAYAALEKKLEETGQMGADFMWAIENGKYQIPDQQAFITTNKKQMQQYADHIKELQSLEGVELVSKINSLYGEDVLVPGDPSSEVTERLALDLMRKFQQGIQGLHAENEHVKDMTQSQYEQHTRLLNGSNVHFNRYNRDFLNEWVTPWAKAGSYHEITRNLKVFNNPAVDFYYKLKLQKNQQDWQSSLYSEYFTEESDDVMIVTGQTEGRDVEGDIGNLKDYKEKSKQLESENKNLIDGFIDQLTQFGKREKPGEFDASKLGTVQTSLSGLAPQLKTVFKKATGREFSVDDLANMEVKNIGGEKKLVFKDDDGKVIPGLELPFDQFDASLLTDVRSKAIALVNKKREYDAFRDQSVELTVENNPALQPAYETYQELNSTGKDPAFLKNLREVYNILVEQKSDAVIQDNTLFGYGTTTTMSYEDFVKTVTTDAMEKRATPSKNGAFDIFSVMELTLETMRTNAAGYSDEVKAKFDQVLNYGKKRKSVLGDLSKLKNETDKTMASNNVRVESSVITNDFGGANEQDNNKVREALEKEVKSNTYDESMIGTSTVENDRDLEKALQGKKTVAEIKAAAQAAGYTIEFQGLHNLSGTSGNPSAPNIAAPYLTYKLVKPGEEKEPDVVSTLRVTVTDGVKMPIRNRMRTRIVHLQKSLSSPVSHVGKLSKTPPKKMFNPLTGEIMEVSFIGNTVDPVTTETTGLKGSKRTPTEGGSMLINGYEINQTEGVQNLAYAIEYGQVMNSQNILPLGGHRSGRNKEKRKELVQILTDGTILNTDFDLTAERKGLESETSAVDKLIGKAQDRGILLSRSQAGALLGLTGVGYRKVKTGVNIQGTNIFNPNSLNLNFNPK